MKIHIVQKGDTLWNLAKKYGVPFEEIKKMNSQLSNPDMIMPGMKIKIPGTAKGHSGGTPKEAPMKPMKPMKEQVMQQQMQPAPMQTKEGMKQKEMQVVQPAPMPQPMPISMPQPAPVVPEVDIHNYYMVNMEKMNVQQPPKMPQQQMAQKEVKKMPQQQMMVQKEAKEMPVMKQPYIQPYVQPECPPQDCVPVSPLMPGPGFCPPPVYQPYTMPMHHHPGHFGTTKHQMSYPYYDESSCMESSHMHKKHFHPYPGVPQPYYGFAGGYPQAGAQQMPMSPHGMHQHFESPSDKGMKGSWMPNQPQQQPAYQQQTAGKEEDCGCDGGKTEPTAYQFVPYQQPQMQQSFMPQDHGKQPHAFQSGGWGTQQTQPMEQQQQMHQTHQTHQTQQMPHYQQPQTHSMMSNTQYGYPFHQQQQMYPQGNPYMQNYGQQTQYGNMGMMPGMQTSSSSGTDFMGSQNQAQFQSGAMNGQQSNMGMRSSGQSVEYVDTTQKDNAAGAFDIPDVPDAGHE